MAQNERKLSGAKMAELQVHLIFFSSVLKYLNYRKCLTAWTGIEMGCWAWRSWRLSSTWLASRITRLSRTSSASGTRQALARWTFRTLSSINILYGILAFLHFLSELWNRGTKTVKKQGRKMMRNASGISSSYNVFCNQAFLIFFSSETPFLHLMRTKMVS